MGLTRIRAEQISDIDYKQAVRVITLSNITLSGGAPSSVDGVNLNFDDRILVAGQSTASQNGLYYVATLGSGSNGTWTRSSDANATGEIEAGMIVMVTEGNTYADTSWKLITNNPITLGSTNLTFAQNTGNSFGVLNANGTPVVANGVTGTAIFDSGNNLVIVGNATSDTITFSVSDTPTFTTVSATGNISASNFVTTGTSGNISGADYITANVFSASGNIVGNYFIGNGSQLTGLPAQYSNANVAAYLPTYSGDFSANNISLIGNILSNGSISATGNLTGNYILGNGALLTGVITSVANINNGTSNVTVTSSGGNVSIGIGGTPNVAVFATTGEYVTGIISVTGNIISDANIAAGNLSTSGNIVGGGVRSTSSASAPSNPAVGDFWYNTATNVQYRFTFDGTSYYWVDDFGSTIGTTGTFNAISNGTSNVTINSANSNVSLSVNGTSNVVQWASTGEYVTGDISATGNITGGNLSVGNGTVTLNNIINGGTSGTGNIGSAANPFNTVYSTATTALYADLAENYVADADYEPGTVVVFGGTKEITVTTQDHDTRVAGVISTNPSYLMNFKLDGLPVALTGRVPCSVVGTITKGALLVTSEIEGVATVLNLNKFIPGCVIGKALENYDSDKVGVIEIAVGRY